MNAFQPGRHIPQGLKPACLLALGGTAEAVPYPKPIYETNSKTFILRRSAPDRARPRVPATFILAEHPMNSATIEAPPYGDQTVPLRELHSLIRTLEDE
jgi:hypothetical protein